MLGAVGLLAHSVLSIELDMDDNDNIRDVAATMAYGMLSRYTGNLTGDVPGNLPDPYHCRCCLDTCRGLHGLPMIVDEIIADTLPQGGRQAPCSAP